MRVKELHKGDRKILLILITYLKVTKSLVLMLSENVMHILKLFLGEGYATHADMKSHTVSVIKMGKGSII